MAKLKAGDIIQVDGWVMLEKVEAGRYRIKAVTTCYGIPCYDLCKPKGRKTIVRHACDNVDGWLRESVDHPDLNKIVRISPASNEAETIEVKLSDIVRGEHPSRSPDPSEDLAYVEELAKDIAEHGQLMPCLVNPLLSGKYKLLTGFGRYAAVSLIAKTNPDATLKCKVADPDEVVAYVMNVSERKTF